MEFLNQLVSDSLTTVNLLLHKIGDGLVSLLLAIAILALGWLITKLVLFVLKKALKVAKVDKLTSKLKETEVFGKIDFKFSISTIILSFVKWILWLAFFIIAADVMQWQIISTEISNLLRYLPKLFSALILFMIGVYIANFVRKAIHGVFITFDFVGAKIISNIVFYCIVILISITSLNQAGIDTDIITNNVTIIFGAFLLTFALSFGFGSKKVIHKLLLSFYTRKNFAVGDKIKMGKIEGTIESIDNICMSIKTETSTIILPVEKIVASKVEIID